MTKQKKDRWLKATCCDIWYAYISVNNKELMLSNENISKTCHFPIENDENIFSFLHMLCKCTKLVSIGVNVSEMNVPNNIGINKLEQTRNV